MKSTRARAAAVISAVWISFGLSAYGGGADTWIKSVGNTNAPIYDGFGSVSNLSANKGVTWLREFNGQIYAAVGQEESDTGNPLSVWCSSDLIHWTQVGAGTFSANDLDSFSIEADGSAHLFIGTHVAPGSGGANIYSSTNGSNWTLFNPGSSGFTRNGAQWASHMTVAAGNLFAGVINTNGSTQVWKRPVDGSANWVKVVDFHTGLGLAGGAKPTFIATYFYFMSNIIFMTASAAAGLSVSAELFQSTDAAGTNWVVNTQVGDGFGDTNNLNLASLVDFNDYFYATVHNTNAGGQLWRTSLTNALANGSQPWTEVVHNGFGQGAIITELHHISKGLGSLWVATQGSTYQTAQVWRSPDGTNWIQSNVDGFVDGGNAGGRSPVVEPFNGHAVWGGGTLLSGMGAQVWRTGDSAISVLGTNGAIVTNNEPAELAKGTDFGSVRYGGAPRTNVFAITNSGSATLTITDVTTNGSEAVSFEIRNCPATMLMGTASNVTVVFTPAAAGAYLAQMNLANNSTNTPYRVNFSGTVTKADSAGVCADYDGDGLADPAVYDEATGTWKVKLSSAGYYLIVTTLNGLGGPGYASVSADYDGDGKADPAVYQEATGIWIILPSSLGYAVPIVLTQTLGGAGYSGMPADYDGDRLADPGVYQREQGDWQVLLSSANYYSVEFLGLLGGTGYRAVAADYDGDHKADPAVYGESNGVWAFLLSSANYASLVMTQSLGGTGYIPVPADYDGDGLADPAIKSQNSNEWIVMFSTGGYIPVLLTIVFD